jgi:hypothetical protein
MKTNIRQRNLWVHPWDALASAVSATEIRFAGIQNLIRAGWRKPEWFFIDAVANVYLVPIGMAWINKASG